MANAPETDSPTKKRRGATVMAWVLMAMIVGGLGGFGVTNFGGGITKIGKVGDREIDVNEYARALRQEMTSLSQQFGQTIGMAQAVALGIDRQVLQQVITRAALDNEATRIGLSAGDAVVASQISGMSQFQGSSGAFDRQAYRQTLQQNNLSEGEFESGLRSDITRSLLQGAVTGGMMAPVSLTETMASWAGEERGFSLLRLTEADLPSPLAKPGDADLTAYYNDHIADFTRPEAKRITYVALLPEVLAKDMPLDEAKLKEAYQGRLSEFVIPEKRLVERLVYGTEDEAKAAKARLDAGETFEALVAERKLTLEDIDMGDVSKADLGAAGDAVFGLAGPGVVGPLPSDLGPALFRMNAILPAQETTFEQAHDKLAADYQLDAARKAIATKVEAVDDLLAGGATLEDVAKEQGMTLATTDYAAGADDNDPITADAAFADAAGKLAEGDFAQALLLNNGGLAALRMDQTVPPTPLPFDKVKDKVATAWHADALAKALSAHAATVQKAVAAGGALGAYGIVERTAKTTRQGVVEGAPDSLMKTVFTMKPGDTQVIDDKGFVAIVTLDSITPAATTGADATTLRETIATQAQKAISGDVFTLYTNALTAEAGITLDQAAINAVNAKFNN